MAKLELEIIKNAGIVGAGGAGFPTYVKLGAQIDLLIINGAECEPLIHVDKQLLGQYFEKIYDGMRIAADLTGAKKIILSLRAKYKDAIKVIEDFKNQNDF
jgi:Na+-translocating ferredoxin:NAD+ oxidoreductase RnfC subunit